MTEEVKVPLSDEELDQVAGGQDLVIMVHPPKDKGDSMIGEEEYRRRQERGEDVSMYAEQPIPVRIVFGG